MPSRFSSLGAITLSQRSIIHLLTVALGAVLIHWTIYAAAETASPDQALSDILKSLETLRSTPDSLDAVRKLLLDEENRLETGLAETAAEIERLKAAIIEAERNRDALQGRLAALQTGRALLSGPAGDPAGTEPPPANPPEVEQPAPSGPPPKESEDEQPPKQTLLTTAEAKVDFERDIRPIIINNCFACHGPDPNQRKGDLRLDRREDLVRETEGGRHIVTPGDPSKSELYRRITLGEDPDLMPPKSSGKELKPEQVELIRKWIEQGAEWAGHWAYITPKRPPLPTVNNSAWVRNEIDAFILARLEQEGLSPSPEAPKHTLIRRLSFDLIGLPPRPDEVSAFLADNSPEAYEKVVDRLLASKHYGERMAQQWLDLSRYADSDGYHADFTRSLWQYRDWVINAFNTNKPFDEFTVEQLAGDLLPSPTLDQKVATAFNRNGMTNTEGGADAAEYATKYVIDRVNTTSTVWLGISMGCCECHNHKFDPFTQREFYQLYDFFNQLPEAGLDKDPCPPFMKLPSDEQKAEMERLTAKAGELERQLAAKVAEESPELDRLQGEWENRLLAGTLHIPGFNFSHWSVVGPFPARTQDEAFSNEYGPERGVDLAQKFEDGKLAWVERPEWEDGAPHDLPGANELGATYLFRTLNSEEARVATFYLGSNDGLKVWFNGETLLSKDQGRKLEPNQDTIQVNVRKGENTLLLKVTNHGGAYGFYFSSDAKVGVNRLARVKELVRIDRSGRTVEQADEIRKYYRTEVAPEIKSISLELAVARKSIAELDQQVPTVRIMQDMDPPRPTHILVRGDYRNQGEQVQPGVPAVLGALPVNRRPTRLDLAKWLVDPKHPLVSRVTVNRYWQMYFGTGLVKTSEDFGVNGELPSHPELLDWLAVEFVESGWDIKALQKKVVMSATYRQQSCVSEDIRGRDPENRLLARGPRLRLPAEMVRDNALAIAGLFDWDRPVGGPSVRPYQPPGLWEEKAFTGSIQYVQSKGQDLYRRGIYTFWKRSVPYPQFVTFDAPNREVCTARRERTNTPLQAFVTLNEDTYVEAARFLAQRMILEGGATPLDKINYACMLALARPAEARECGVLLDLYNEMLLTYQGDWKGAVDLVSIGESPRNPDLNVMELAAWTTVASTILNLDETITKE